MPRASILIVVVCPVKLWAGLRNQSKLYWNQNMRSPAAHQQKINTSYCTAKCWNIMESVKCNIMPRFLMHFFSVWRNMAKWPMCHEISNVPSCLRGGQRQSNSIIHHRHWCIILKCLFKLVGGDGLVVCVSSSIKDLLLLNEFRLSVWRSNWSDVTASPELFLGHSDCWF